MSIDAMKWARKVAETGKLNTGQAFVLLLLRAHRVPSSIFFSTSSRSSTASRSVDRISAWD